MTEAIGAMPIILIDKNDLVQGAKVLQCPYATTEGCGLIHCTCKDKPKYDCSYSTCYENAHCKIKKALKASEAEIEKQQENYYGYIVHKGCVFSTLSITDKLELCYANYLKPNVHRIILPIALEVINMYLSNNHLDRLGLTFNQMKKRCKDYNNQVALDFLNAPSEIFTELEDKFANIPRINVEELFDQSKEKEQPKEKEQLEERPYILQVEIPDKKSLEEIISVIKAEEFLNIQMKVYKNLN